MFRYVLLLGVFDYLGYWVIDINGIIFVFVGGMIFEVKVLIGVDGVNSQVVCYFFGVVFDYD